MLIRNTWLSGIALVPPVSMAGHASISAQLSHSPRPAGRLTAKESRNMAVATRDKIGIAETDKYFAAWLEDIAAYMGKLNMEQVRTMTEQRMHAYYLNRLEVKHVASLISTW